MAKNDSPSKLMPPPSNLSAPESKPNKMLDPTSLTFTLGTS